MWWSRAETENGVQVFSFQLAKLDVSKALGLEAISGFFLQNKSVMPASTNNKTSTATYNGL